MLILSTMKNYDNFKESLLKETDVMARENIDRLYRNKFPSYQQQMIDYDSDYGRFLQSAGVDVILFNENYYGGLKTQYWIQEKITFRKYDKLLFEYEKHSGAKGWAISPSERADFLLYYQDGDVYIMNFDDIRNYVTENLERLKKTGYVRTDNHNVLVPIKELQQNLRMLVYKENSY